MHYSIHARGSDVVTTSRRRIGPSNVCGCVRGQLLVAADVTVAAAITDAHVRRGVIIGRNPRGG